MARLAFLLLIVYTLGCSYGPTRGEIFVSEGRIGLDTGIFELIENDVRSRHRQSSIPGGQLAIAHRGELVYTFAFGNERPEGRGSRIQPDTLFDIASITKAVISAAAFAAGDAINQDVLNIFQHRMGIDDAEAYPLFLEKDPRDWPSLAASWRFPIIRQPYRYSNVGWFLLGFGGVGVDSEQRLRQLGLTRTIWDPMVSSRIAPTDFLSDQRLLRGEAFDPLAATAVASGVVLPFHSGLFSTASDLAPFFTRVATETEWLQPAEESRDDLGRIIQQSISGLREQRAHPFGNPNRPIHSVYTMAGYTGTWAWIDRETGLGFVLLTNAILTDSVAESERMAGEIARFILIGSRSVPRIQSRN